VPYKRIYTNSDYNKKKKYVDKEIEKGESTLETYYKETVYECTRIGNDLYLPVIEVENQIQTTGGRDKVKARFDYSGLLFGTVDGLRVSMQEMIAELSVAYNVIRFMINRELSKIKGKSIWYNRAFLPKKKSMKDILYQMTEDSIVEYNTAEDGNQSEIDGRDLSTSMKEVDLGASSSLPMLIEAGINIENTLEQITGLTRNRQGLTRASETAHGVETSLQASRSVTYDMFYSMAEFTEDVLLKLAEKTKLNWTTIDEEGAQMILGSDEMSYLKVTKDISNDEYGVTLTDGRKESETKERLRSLYELQINAGELRAQDVARAEMQESFSEYIQVLDDAWETIQKQREKEMLSKEKQTQMQLEMQDKIAKENREDIQAHEIQLEQVAGQIKKEIEMIKADIKNYNSDHETANKSMLDRQNQDSAKEIEELRSKNKEK